MTQDLVNTSGRPLIPEPRLIVLKIPRNLPFNHAVTSQLAKTSNCAVIELPMDSEVLMGEMASKELSSLHHAIHAILEIPDNSFSKSDLGILYSALRFLCEKTAPKDSSREVSLMKELKVSSNAQ